MENLADNEEHVPIELQQTDDNSSHKCNDTKDPNDHDNDDGAKNHNDNNGDSNDVWDRQGYSPLLCLDGNLGGTMTMAAMGTTMTWGYNDDDEDDDDDDDDKEETEVVYNSKGQEEDQVETEEEALAGSQEEDIDFRKLADQALLQLDLDYQETIQKGMGSSSPGSVPDSCFLVPSDLLRDQIKPLKALESGTTAEKSVREFADFSLFQDNNTYQKQEAHYLPAAPSSKILPDIDSDAVRRAMNNLQKQQGRFATKYKQWEYNTETPVSFSKQTSSLWAASLIVPHSHPCIPQSILRLFASSPTTTTEQQTTSNWPDETQQLTRAATLVDALNRTDALQRQETLVVHLIGCDHVELHHNHASIPSFLQPVLQWLPRARQVPSKLEFHLIGPNLQGLQLQQKVDSSLELQKLDSSSLPVPLESVVVEYHRLLYHEFLQQDRQEHETKPADLIVSFHAGIWGYDDWKPTLQYLQQKSQSSNSFARKRIPFVMTAYTLWEAEEDYEVLVNDLTGCQLLWKPQLNPFGSHTTRPTANVPAGQTEAYRENAAWQAWKI